MSIRKRDALQSPPRPAFALMPTDLPPPSDSSAVEILGLLHELVFRLEAHYGGQIHRYAMLCSRVVNAIKTALVARKGR